MSADRPILIVEDDEALREALTERLTADGGFTAIGAGTLEEASNILAAKDARFDAVILDVGLPDGNGFDFCARLRQLGHNMPVIMLTGWDTEDDVVRGLDAGASDYIAKPVSAPQLLSLLRVWLSKDEGGKAEDDKVTR